MDGAKLECNNVNMLMYLFQVQPWRPDNHSRTANELKFSEFVQNSEFSWACRTKRIRQKWIMKKKLQLRTRTEPFVLKASTIRENNNQMLQWALCRDASRCR